MVCNVSTLIGMKNLYDSYRQFAFDEYGNAATFNFTLIP